MISWPHRRGIVLSCNPADWQTVVAWVPWGTETTERP